MLVLVSGGRDSVCLLDVARTLCGGTVRALHVNYGLREGAAGDERHCAELCRLLGVPLEVHRPAGPPSGNLQAWAREERYRAAAGLMRDPLELVAVGHTASDQVETILYRLASSPSRRALLGMRAREGHLVRPLLSLTREETTEYCLARGLPWREDPSNDTADFVRGRVRAELVPALRRLHPAAEANVIALARILREEAELLDGLVDEVLEGAAEIPLDRLRSLPLALARLVVQRLADGVRGGPAPGTARRAQEILALSNHARLDLPHGICAIVRNGTLTMAPRT